MVSQTAWLLHTKIQIQLLGLEVTKWWIAGSWCQEKEACEDWMGFKCSWCYTVKAHLGSYLTCWMQTEVPLVIFHPSTARGIEIPHWNSSVCLSNCTLLTACQFCWTALALAKQWLTRTKTETKPSLFSGSVAFLLILWGLGLLSQTSQEDSCVSTSWSPGFKNNGCNGDCGLWAILRPCLGFSKIDTDLHEGYNPFKKGLAWWY